MTGLEAHDRFECWRSWCSQAIDVPMRLEPIRRLPYHFDASVEALTVGAVDFVEYRSGPAVGSWTRDAITPADRLRLMILAPSPDGRGSCYARELSLAGGAAAGADTALARRLALQHHVRAHLADPRLSPATIAAALHISRSTLYAALPAGSDGIAAEIRHQRLARAHAILRDPANAQSIAEIATSVGMPSAAQFSRTFRNRYGLTPRELRADHRRDRRAMPGSRRARVPGVEAGAPARKDRCP